MSEEDRESEDRADRLNPDLLLHLKSMTRFIYVVTEEEDRLLIKLSQVLSKFKGTVEVYNGAMGLVPLEEMLRDWTTTRAHNVTDTVGIHDALIRIYQRDPRDQRNFFIITDPERWLSDQHVQRRILNIQQQLHSDERNIKILIFVSNRLNIPLKLQRYIEVVHDRGMGDAEIYREVTVLANKLQIEPPNKTIVEQFRGLTHWEMQMSTAQSIVRTKKDKTAPKRIDPRVISDFRRRQLNKTDLLQYVNTDNFSFDQIGGAGNFKEWAEKTKAAWTPEGQKFGLIPPKGVLSIGVWGCGKSLSVKALGNAWKLSVVQLETGKLRSSGVGESEANVYRALALIESVAPCIVWVDEAEKNFSGTASSGQSDAGTTSRMTGIMSTWLQETKAKVCLAMTANSLRGLPIEFVNRMDERFFYDLPAEEERIEILKIHLRKRGQNPENFRLADLAEAAKDMVGREIEQAIGSALTESFAADKPALDNDILQEQLLKKPRIFRTMGDEMKEILDWVGFDPDLNDGIRARHASKYRSQAVQNRFAIK